MTPQKQEFDLGITRLEYGETARERRAVLQIETSKYYNGGIISDATVYWVGPHSRSNMLALGGDGGDYGKRIRVTDRTVKATQKNVDRQHAEVFTAEYMAQLIEHAKLHYAGIVRKGVDEFGNVYPAQEVSA